MGEMESLSQLLDELPPGCHVRVIKTRRFPQWNPWRVAAYRHERALRLNRWRRVDVPLGHADAPTVDEAAAMVLRRIREANGGDG